jgi:Copper amine oxidase N-terminal domain
MRQFKVLTLVLLLVAIFTTMNIVSGNAVISYKNDYPIINNTSEGGGCSFLAYNYEMDIKKCPEWSETATSDYPEIVVKGSSDNRPVMLWTPDSFKGEGKLGIKWTSNVSYKYRQTNTFFNNTPEGWLYITTDSKPADNDIVLGENYSNHLINPSDGKTELLEPKYSMFSIIKTDPHICCSPAAHIDTEDEYPVDIRCYDISDRELRWHIRDTRGGVHNCAPYLPVDYCADNFFYSINGITSFDSRTGEIDWSFTYRDEDDAAMLSSYYVPVSFSEKYIFLLNKVSILGTKFSTHGIRSYSFDAKNKIFLNNTYRTVECRWEGLAFIKNKHNPYFISFEHNGEKMSNLYKFILLDTEMTKYWVDLDLHYQFLTLHPELKGKSYIPSQIETIGEYYAITYCNDCDPLSDYGSIEHYTRPRNPQYESNKYHFTLHQTELDKLIQVAPDLTKSNDTYMQVIDDELIIQTSDLISCFDTKALSTKWTIDKSEYEKPEDAFVCAVDWRGVLVMEDLEDKDGNKYSKFRCYNVTPEEPEPTPEPTPEPLPVDEKIILRFTIDKKEYSLDGVISPIDTSPIIKNGRTLIPARFVTEPLGGDVSWDVDEKKVVCILGDITIEMWINEPIALVNGKEVQIDPHNPDVTPTIIDDRTMVPIRFLAENLGCETKWDAETKEIILTYRD